jgi:2-polyprenyl-3-methyl-5-hydroxy-6-metoxy-1,4-benzoquinol methylase
MSPLLDRHMTGARVLTDGEAELISSSDARPVPCPLCGAWEDMFYCRAPSHYGPETYAITQCRACGMVYTNPQFDFYEKVAETRGAKADIFKPERLAEQSRHTAFLMSLLKPHLRVGKPRLLDFGCGGGALAWTAATLGWDAYGYDVNVGAVAEANRRWNTDRFVSDLSFLTTRRESFDIAIAFQVFEHLPKPMETGRDLVSLVRRGGLVLIDVPNVSQLGELKAKGSTLDPTAHVCHFSLATLTRLLEQLGCETVYRSAAPSFFSVYSRLHLGGLAYPLGRLSKRMLPGIGSGACVIGRKR